MLTQLLLFDLASSPANEFAVVGSAAPANRVANQVCEPAQPFADNKPAAQDVQPVPGVQLAQRVQPVQMFGTGQLGDTLKPMGDLARLVIARYDMLAQRRQEALRRKAEQPRKSIRVLS